MLRSIYNDNDQWCGQAFFRGREHRGRGAKFGTNFLGTEGGHNIVRVNSKLEVRRHFFSQRVAEKWNALPSNLKSYKSVAPVELTVNERENGEPRHSTSMLKLQQQEEYLTYMDQYYKLMGGHNVKTGSRNPYNGPGGHPMIIDGTAGTNVQKLTRKTEIKREHQHDSQHQHDCHF